MVKRFLYWFSCKIDGIPELNRLPYAERARITVVARQAMFWAETSDRRQVFWFLLFFHAYFVCLILALLGYTGLGFLIMAGIATGWVFDGRSRYMEIYHDQVRRIVAEKEPAAKS